MDGQKKVIWAAQGKKQNNLGISLEHRKAKKNLP